MARRTRKTQLEEERMTDSNISRVIKLLEPEDGSKPISKKDACQILGMSYNTTRLAQIIDKYKEQQAKDAARRAEKRGKPLAQDEITYIIQEYLSGSTVDYISGSIYRGPQLIKQVLEKYAVPTRARSTDYFKPELIPEKAMKDRFAIGETVYSARYNAMAKIRTEMFQNNKWVYGIWVTSGDHKQNAYQPAEELASLAHIRELGIKV